MPVAELPDALLRRVLPVAAEAKMNTQRIAAQSQGFGLRFYGDPILALPAEPVPLGAGVDRDSLQAFASALRRVCAERRGGVAIAAQQVGCLGAVILTPVNGVRTIMINPRIVTGRTGRPRWSRTIERGLEGCLSVPDFWVNVERHTWVEVEYTPEDLSERVTVKLEGFEARAAQHELDHLAGRCIVDGLTRQQRRHAERCVAKARGRR